MDLTQFRAYDPVLGRWWQVDPLASEMSSWTPYNYGFNNPIRFNDPLGDAPSAMMRIGNTNDNIGQDQSKDWFGEQRAMHSNGGRDGKDPLPDAGDKGKSSRGNCCPSRGNNLGFSELEYQKYPVGADLKSTPDKLLEDLLSVFDWLQMENGMTRRPGSEMPDSKFFHVSDLIKNIPINNMGDTNTQTITSGNLMTSSGIRFTWGIKPAKVARPGDYYRMGYIHDIRSNQSGNLGQIHMMNGHNTTFTLSIYGRQNFVDRFNKIFKGRKIIE